MPVSRAGVRVFLASLTVGAAALMTTCVPTSDARSPDVAQSAATAAPDYALARLRSLVTFAPWSYGIGNSSYPDSVFFFTSDTLVGVASVDRDQRRLTVDRFDRTTWAAVGSPVVVDWSDWEAFGGFLAAEDGTFYLLLGNSNRSEELDRVVVGVRRYSAAWENLGTAVIRGNPSEVDDGIYEPFRFGAPDMALVGSRLVVHMARLGFAQDDGRRHQSNFTFEVDPSSMVATTLGTLDGPRPFVSHSFRQFVMSSGETPVFVDHGDANPRSVVVQVGDRDSAGAVHYRAIHLLPLLGSTGDNETGTTVTGAAIVGGRVLVVGTSVPHGNPVQGVTGFDSSMRRNAYLATADVATGDHTFTWLTELAPQGSTESLEPRIIEVPGDRAAVLFSTLHGDDVYDVNATLTLEYRLVTPDGSVLGSRSWGDGYFSPIADPLLRGSEILWPGIDLGAVLYDRPASVFAYGLDVADPLNPERLGSPAVVEPADGDSSLQAISVRRRALANFSPARTKYRVTLPRTYASVSVAAMATSPTTRLSYRLDSGWRACHRLPRCRVGVDVQRPRVLRFRATAEDGTSTTYAVTLVRR